MTTRRERYPNLVATWIRSPEQAAEYWVTLDLTSRVNYLLAQLPTLDPAIADVLLEIASEIQDVQGRCEGCRERDSQG